MKLCSNRIILKSRAYHSFIIYFSENNNQYKFFVNNGLTVFVFSGINEGHTIIPIKYNSQVLQIHFQYQAY
jgi:hypothetical protein